MGYGVRYPIRRAEGPGLRVELDRLDSKPLGELRVVGADGFVRSALRPVHDGEVALDA
jgi:hypothetical protein